MRFNLYSPVHSQLEQLSAFLPASDISQAQQKFDDTVAQVQDKLQGIDDTIDKVQLILDIFYFDNLFCLSVNQPHNAGHNMASALAFHCAETPLLAVILVDLLRHAEVDAAPVMAQAGALVRVSLSENQFIFIKADSGMSLDWPEVEQHIGLRRQDKLNKDDNEIKGPNDLTIADNKEIDLLLLNLFKSELIELACFEQAFEVSQVLLELDPDNPYERRDRGFLLQQMDCDKLAVADYEFFIEQCPKDPVAQVLKTQLPTMQNHRRDIH